MKIVTAQMIVRVKQCRFEERYSFRAHHFIECLLHEVKLQIHFCSILNRSSPESLHSQNQIEPSGMAEAVAAIQRAVSKHCCDKALMHTVVKGRAVTPWDFTKRLCCQGFVVATVDLKFFTFNSIIPVA